MDILLKAGLFDLHLHSSSSDGELTPKNLMTYAAERGITALSLTDHDSIDGVAEAAERAHQLGLCFIPAVELSVDFDQGEMHILGYGVKCAEPLLGYLAEQKASREARNEGILKKLKELNLLIDIDDVLRHARKGAETDKPILVGRPHFAMALLEKGYVRNVADAFNLYLAKGKPAYVTRKQPSPRKAIEIIRASGGVAVLAHPVLLNINNSAMTQLLPQLISYGLEGLEALHSDHSKDRQNYYRELAAAHGLLVTGGSDFHGPIINPEIEIGRGHRHNLRLNEMNLVEALINRIQERV